MNELIGRPEESMWFLTLEIFFTIIIIMAGFLIYYKTRDLYKLSEHKGIKFFMKGFLFISFSYILSLILVISKIQIINLVSFDTISYFFKVNDLFFLIGILYLFSSIFSKQIKEYFIYLIGIFLFIFSILLNTKFLLGIFSTIIILFLGIVSFYKIKKSKKKKTFTQIYIIYILIFLSWLISFLSKILTDLFPRGKTINIITLGLVFLYVLYLVDKKFKK